MDDDTMLNDEWRGTASTLESLPLLWLAMWQRLDWMAYAAHLQFIASHNNLCKILSLSPPILRVLLSQLVGVLAVWCFASEPRIKSPFVPHPLLIPPFSLLPPRPRDDTFVKHVGRREEGKDGRRF